VESIYTITRKGTPNSVDKLGLYEFKLLFNALYKKLAEWLDEPCAKIPPRHRL